MGNNSHFKKIVTIFLNKLSECTKLRNSKETHKDLEMSTSLKTLNCAGRYPGG
jgi:hypothetical protein